MSHHFAIGIPTLNRADLLIPALLYYKNDFPNTEIFVLDNGNQEKLLDVDHPHLTIIAEEQNIGVAASWNKLCKVIFLKHSNALILNDDIYLGKSEQDLSLLIQGMDVPFYTTPLDWCAFILPKTTFEKVGDFDEGFFPAYFEDNDYAYRMKLMGMGITKIPYLIPSVHRVSQTMEYDDSVRVRFHKNKKRYIEKWGGEPMQEKYKTPFDSK